MPFRIVLYIILIIFELAFGTRMSSWIGRRGLFDGLYDNVYGYGNGVDERGYEPGIGSRFIASIRRRRALKKCKKFLIKNKDNYILENERVRFIFNKKTNDMQLKDKINRRNSVKYDFNKQADYQNYILESFYNEIIDNVFGSFNQDANFNDLNNYLLQYFVPTSPKKTNTNNAQKNETKKQKRNQKAEMQTVEEFFAEEKNINILAPSERININKASIEELSKLPGITIIIAKKIVKYIEKNGEFWSINEFYQEMKIKHHFQEKLDLLISVDSEYQDKKIIIEKEPEHKVRPKNNERVLDLNLENEDKIIIIENNSEQDEKPQPQNNERLIDF